MSEATANPFHPKRWTALTWLALLLWAWRPFVMNFPPSESYTVDQITGEYSEPVQYQSLSELPFPFGWPLFYVKPSYLTIPAVPMLAGAPVPPPVPSTVHPFAMAANLILVVIAMSSLVYFLQKTRLRFSLLFLFIAMMSVALYFRLGRLIGTVAGYEAAWWYSLAVYFLPIPAALAVRFSISPRRLQWLDVRAMWKRSRHGFNGYANADDVMAAASRLEMRGDWTESIDLYRHASEHWPEHKAYIQQCIDGVTKKQSLAQSQGR